MTNANWILTKNRILQKARYLLEGIQAEQQDMLDLYKQHLPVEVLKTSPKISKGENYKGLPYLILDNPRCFDKEKILAVRTMFWWGNFFSVTLHLSGSYKKMFEEKIIASYKTLKENNFSLCNHNKEWDHHFEKNNYILLGKLRKAEFENQVCKKSFVKLAKKMPLQNWTNAQSMLSGYFRQVIEILVA